MKKILLMCSFLMVVTYLNGQEKFIFQAFSGVSRFVKTGDDASSYLNNYGNIMMFKTGVSYMPFGIEKILYPSTGAFFSIKGAENQVLEFNSEEVLDSWSERIYAINIPLKLHYKFDDWLIFNSGISGSVPVARQFHYKDENMKTYFAYLNFSAGFDIKIKNFCLSAEYQRGISNVMETPWADIYYTEQTIVVGFGIMF